MDAIFSLFELFGSGPRPPQAAILDSVGFVAAWLSYLLLAPIVFFAPLNAAREGMETEKDAALARLSMEMRNATDREARGRVASEYREVLRARTWPFNAQTILSFAANIATPLVLTVATELITSVIRN